MGINVQEESLFVLTRIITNWPRIDSRIRQGKHNG